MKNGHKRLLFFELIIIVLLLLNNFVSSILSGYWKVLFFIILLVLFKYLFGFEKDRNRYWKSVCLEVIIFLLAYFLIYYLSGLIFSFYKPINYYTFSNVKNIFIPLVLSIILKEILRYMMLKKSEGSKRLIVSTSVLFILIDLIGKFNAGTFKTPYTIFMFLALYVLPAISKNVVCSYMSIKVGYRPPILYLLVIEMHVYLLPLIPNPNEYIYALFQLLAPFVLLYRLYVFYKADRDEDIERVVHKKRVLGLIPCAIIISILAYLTSGYFRYHALVIGSGSMVPNIHKGDVVIVEKNKKRIEDLEIGQVIAVKHENIIVVHRLVKKIQANGQYYAYTKGDANNDIDSYKISDDMIYGVVNVKIPYIGYPTVWLNNL